MSSYLNPYQTAILQEMGICVWQSQSALNQAVKPEDAETSPANQSREAVSASTGVAPTAANGQARIAQLRSMLGNKDDKKGAKVSAPAPASDTDASPVRDSQLQSQLVTKAGESQASLETSQAAAEAIDPRSFGQMGRDIMLALSLFHDVKAIRWQYGQELSLKDNVLSLPYKTAPTHAADKRRLWQVISAQ